MKCRPVTLKDYMETLGVSKTTAVKYRRNDKRELKIKKGRPLLYWQFEDLYFHEILEQKVTIMDRKDKKGQPVSFAH